MNEAGRSVAVVGWDMGHNALSRSWVLADVLRHSGWSVQLAGPICQGRTVWEPLRDATPRVEGFVCRGMADVIFRCVRHVEGNPHRVVVVSKQRFPSMLLGLLYKRRWGARVVVDIDDDELALGGASQALDPSIMRKPPGNVLPDNVRDPMWTAIGEGMLDLADAITVAGVGLQQRYGGEIVRHARDRKAFDPALFDPAGSRAKFGLPATGRLVMFLGSPRAHKGLAQVIEFIRASSARDLKLCVTDRFTDPRERATLQTQGGDHIVFMPPVTMNQVPELLSAADFVCLPQDDSSSVSRYQVPAKMSDAIAMQVPLMMAPTEGVADLSALRIFVNEGALDAAAFERAVTMSRDRLMEVVGRADRVFDQQFTYEAVGAVLEKVTSDPASKPLPAWSIDVLAMVDQVAVALAKRNS